MQITNSSSPTPSLRQKISGAVKDWLEEHLVPTDKTDIQGISEEKSFDPAAMKKSGHLHDLGKITSMVGTGLAVASLAIPAALPLHAVVIGATLWAGHRGSKKLEQEGQKVWDIHEQLPYWKEQLDTPDGEGKLAELHPRKDELKIMQNVLHAPGGDQHFQDFLDGAHIIVPDKGQLYQSWKGMESAHGRKSSHQSAGEQFEIDGKLTGPILFGETSDRQGTWLQLERDSIDLTPTGITHAVAHLKDFFDYRLTGENLSRYGHSPYTEAYPLVL